MKKKPGIIRSTKVRMLSLRLTHENKAALQAFADATYDGNISKAALDIILAVVCDRHILIFQRHLIAVEFHLGRFCSLLREESKHPELSELGSILEALEQIQLHLIEVTRI
jgi:hypothetical protein